MKTSTKNNQTGHAFLLIALAIILMLVVALVGLKALKPHESKTPVTTIFSNILTTSKTQFGDSIFSDRVGWPAENGIGMPLNALGYSFKISSENMPTLEFVPSESAADVVDPECDYIQADLQPKNCAVKQEAASHTTVRSIITTEMKRDGFVKQKAYSFKDADDDDGLTATVEPYVSGSRGCVYAERADIRFSCYDKTSIKQAAAELAPFITEYQKQSQPDNATYYGPLQIKTSQDTHFRTAKIIVVKGNNRKVAFFYSKNKDAWHYVDQTNDELGLSCKKLASNADVRIAFYAHICQAADGAIRLDSSQPAY